MRRREFLKTSSAAAALGGLALSTARADVPDHRWDGFDFGKRPTVTDRLNQGPFGIDQGGGDSTIAYTTFSDQPVKNYGLGLVGYAWEENGPSLGARNGTETLEQHVEKLASLPFVDILYIRCDWRDVQVHPGKLDLHPIWKLALDAAKRYNLRVGFRIQLSSPNIQPKRISMPDFLHDKVPLVNIGRRTGARRTDFDFFEPRYDHPEFQKAFRELNDLLVAEFDDNALMEYMDLMMYGFWGEGHTNELPNPFPDYLTAERTFVQMTQIQIDSWRKVPLAVNTQPDISKVGNREVQDMALRAGCWLRSDSIIGEEPIQIEELSNRPPWLPVVMEDGRNRHHFIDEEALKRSRTDVRYREKAGLHVLDLGANYWGLWTEADNLRQFHEKYPRSFDTLRQRMGYRIRPSWIWQRPRYDTIEVIVALANDGVAGIPGVLRVYVESQDGKVRVGGGLDAGHPYGGRLRQASFVLPKGMDGQQMVIRAEVETKGGIRRPIQWACSEPVNPNGSFNFQLLGREGRRN
jgi:hypothetical protein